MASISDPHLKVEKVVGHPGRRRVVVAYDLKVRPDEPLSGQVFTERVVVRSDPDHGRPSNTGVLNIEVAQDVRATDELLHRSVAVEVDRVRLDVEQDWWETDHGGGVLPIAEFADHIVADLSLVLGSDVVAEATTPVVTGSWGALGRD